MSGTPRRPLLAGITEATDAFISYAREDKAFVTRLHDSLRADGRTAWVDWEGIPPSAQWRMAIEAAITNGQSFVFVISRFSATSVVCAEEAAIAARHNKKIIPLVLEDVEHAQLPDAIARRQWIFARATDVFETAVGELLRAMDLDLDWVHAHTRLLDRALRWTADRERASLLEGHELDDAEAWLVEADTHEQKATSEQTAYIASSRWRARLDDADGHVAEARQLLTGGRAQAAAAHLLRALELAPEGAAPPEYASSRQRPNWAEEAWTIFRYVDAKRGRLRHRLVGHDRPISNLAVSADGTRLATASFDGTARLWDLMSGVLVATLDTHGGAVGAVVFSSAGAVVTGGENGALYAWTLNPPTPQRILPKPGDPITALALDAAGHSAMGLQSGYVAIIDQSGAPIFHERIHGGSITSIVFTADGRHMLTASGRPAIGGWLGEGTVSSWDLKKKKQRTAMFGTITGRIVAIGISADGTTGLRSLEGGAIEVWDLVKSEQVQTLHQPETARCLAFSPDGSVAVSGADDSTIRLWNTKDWTERQLLDGHLAAVTALVFCNDGQTLVSGSIDQSVAVWNLDGLPEATPIEEHADGYAVVAAAPGTPMVAAGRGDGVVRLWDVANHELVTSFGDEAETKSSPANALCFSNDAGLLAVGSRDGTLSVWKRGSSEPLLQKKGPLVTSLAWVAKKTAVVFAFGDRGSLVEEHVAFGAAGGRIAKASRRLGGVVMNDFRNQPGYTIDRHSMGIAALAVTPDGRRLITASEDGTARVWDMNSRRQLRVLSGHTNYVWGLAISRDGRTVVTSSLDADIRIWNIETGETKRIIDGHTGGVGCVAFTTDGKQLVSASADKTIRFWNPETGEQLRQLDGHTAPVTAVAVSADGRRAVSTTSEGELCVWNLTTENEWHSLSGHTEMIHSVAITPDGLTAVSCSADGTARIWDLEHRTTRHTLNAFGATPFKVAISPDGTTAACGYEDYAVRLWNLASGSLDAILSGHRSEVISVAYASSGARLVSGSQDAQVLVWEPPKDAPVSRITGRLGGELAVALTEDGTRLLIGGETGLRLHDLVRGEDLGDLPGHTAPVTGVVVTTDGAFAASSSMDGTIRLWDVARRRAMQVLSGHKAPVVAVALSTDERVVYGASQDGTVSAWSVRTGTRVGTYGTELREGFEVPLVSESGMTMQIAVAGGDAPKALASVDAGVVVGSSRRLALLKPFHPSLPATPPKTADEFNALYATLGLRVFPEGGLRFPLGEA
jgi:WD40 repeat protein